MKSNIVFLIIFLVLCSLNSKSQDLTLPQGKSIIYLNSGKTIKEAKIWTVDSLKIEYVKNGNLADVMTSEVLMIVFSDGTKRIFNKLSKSDNTITNNYNLNLTHDTLLFFRLFNFSLGLGKNFGKADNLFSDSFLGCSLQGITYDNLGNKKSIEGKPFAYLTENVCIDGEFNYNSRLKFGIGYRPYNANFNGYSGMYDVTYLFVKEEINGSRIYFNCSYSVKRYVKSFGLNIEIGSSFISNSAKIYTQMQVFDNTSANAIHAPQVGSVTERERKQSFGFELYGRLDICLGKTFSFFIKAYNTKDFGYIINAKTLFTNNQMAYLPSQKINFSGFGMQTGIAFHFVKGKSHN